MAYIGNIINNSKVEDSDLFNVVQDMSGVVDGIPTLIVGWEKAKELSPKVPSIIESEIIEDSLYWTFDRKVKRDVYERDISQFKEKCRKLLLKKISYSFYNVLSPNKTEAFFAWMSSDTKKTVYLFNNMLYVYMDGCSKVIGVSLMDVEYGGTNKKVFLGRVFSCANIAQVNQELVTFSIKSNFRNWMYIIPYLFSC